MVVHYPRTAWKNSYAEHEVTVGFPCNVVNPIGPEPPAVRLSVVSANRQSVQVNTAPGGDSWTHREIRHCLLQICNMLVNMSIVYQSCIIALSSITEIAVGGHRGIGLMWVLIVSNQLKRTVNRLF